MSLSQLLKKSREAAGISLRELSEGLGVPEPLLRSLEEPQTIDEEAVSLLAHALGITQAQFRGEQPFVSTEKKIEAAIRAARYPAMRAYLVDPDRCENPEIAMELFQTDPFSLAEKNLALYLSTTALYHFCDTNTSHFSFDTYLFKLHAKLMRAYEEGLNHRGIDAEQKRRLLDAARSNIFCCERMENIAVLILDDFAAELEQKLSFKDRSFERELSMPLSWYIDNELMRIVIHDSSKQVIDTIKLLDVKERGEKS